VDALIVGGGIANTFIMAAGGSIGSSLAEPELVGEAKAILDEYPGKVPVPSMRSSPRSSRRRRSRRSRPSRTSSPTTSSSTSGPRRWPC
jgi:3-phosphoglycerate kinase